MVELVLGLRRRGWVGIVAVSLSLKLGTDRPPIAALPYQSVGSTGGSCDKCSDTKTGKSLTRT